MCWTRDLPAADANGKGDPYVKFELNGSEVFKTKVQKRRFIPHGMNSSRSDSSLRTGAKFKATVMDWDFGNSDDLLGATNISLAQLEPFKGSRNETHPGQQDWRYPVEAAVPSRLHHQNPARLVDLPWVICSPRQNRDRRRWGSSQGGAAVAHGVGKGGLFP